MKIFRGILFGGIAALVACGAPAAPAPPAAAPAPQQAVPAAADTGLAAIRADRILSHVAYLASDELRGRDTPSPGLERAAEYLAAELANHGLEPMGDNGTFFQRWPYVTARMGPDVSRLQLRGSDPGTFRYGRDFFAFTARQATATGAAVYVGTLDALEAAPADAVRGRIVFALLPGVPGLEMLEAGARAAEAGAAGLVLVLDPGIAPQIIRPLADWLEEGVGAGQPIPTLGMLYRSARQLFESAGVDLDRHLRAPPVAPVPLEGATLEIAIGADVQEHMPPNVVAVIPGRDAELRDTYIAISAHFDHVGVGQPVNGDSIHNGADDNASGTAALLAVARAFASRPERPARSVLFVAVSGEEKGLLGSRHFAENPPVPVDRIVANINLDMVGRNHPDSLVVIGEDYTTMGPLARRVAAANPELRLTLAPDPDPSEQVFFRSDHFSFAREGIPAIFFTTWLHEDYHRPTDRVERIDQDKIARIARLVYLLTEEVATDPTPPEWTAQGRAIMQAIGM